ncbi:hypothetical protein BurJ1DRAFT_4269 [Burkholderiales bacterium JOSHI_001]|nr:hypothetical protein BurJ1DRAFT_4269 [Burkholderiales bacterium JOSHI_001]
MRFRLGGWIIAVACLLLMPWLSGCSTVRLAYNQADDLAYWWADSYVDFDGAQTPRARHAITEWFAWHRSTQLPDYAALLADWGRQAAGDITAAQLCAANDELRARLQRGAERALPGLAQLATTLAPEQLNHLERRLAKNNDDFRRNYLQSDREDRRAATLKRTVERAETFYGTLDARQLALLGTGLAQSPFDAQAWFSERQTLQQQALAQLRQARAEQADSARFEALLRQWLAHSLKSPRPAYAAYQQRLTEFNCNLSAQLHNSTSAAQRQKLRGKFKGWEDDLRALAAPPL